MIVNKQKLIEFNSPVEVIFDKDDLREAILWYSPKPVARLKHVFLHGRYYAVSIYDEKIHVHRLLMMYWLKRDLERDEYVHHVNGNRFNNLKENLAIITASEHQSAINKGKKQTSIHVAKRINSTSITRYGHPVYENP
jgi:hypothetical protein